MAYKHVELDLRLKHHRTRKDYWRGVREGRLPWPKYTKPRVHAVKLDPEQALLLQCKVGFAGWMETTFCFTADAGHAERCNYPLRGRSLVGDAGTGTQVESAPS